MQINPYLHFNGDCEEAFNFYAKALGGEIAFKITYAESPMAGETAKELLGKIMHARLQIGGNVIMGSDAPPGRYKEPQGFSVSISVESAADAERIYKALEEGGDVYMPLAETFWAERFGMLADRFGVPWMINCEKKS